VAHGRPDAGEWTPHPLPLRRFAAGFSVLVLFVALQLLLGAFATDRYFAWALGPPVGAAVFGTAYLGSSVLQWNAAREPVWAAARPAWWGILAFIWVVLLATLLHLDRFHFASAAPVARFSAWAWLIIYILSPIYITWFAARRALAGSSDPPRRAPYPGWFRSLLIVQGVLAVAVAAVLFIAPNLVAPAWPWSLTPLAARAAAAHLAGMGTVALACAREGDFERTRLVLIAYAVVGWAGVLALLIDPGSLRAGTPAVGVWVLALSSVGAAGTYGSWRGRRMGAGGVATA
jgi:hypothetical protein